MNILLKQRNIWLMVLTLFILTAYSQPLTVTTKKMKYTNELMEVDLNIPIVSGSVNPSFQRQVNRLLRKESLDLKREVEKQAHENMAISKKEGFPYRLHAAVSNYEVTYNQHGILSIPVTLYSYTGGAHGMTVKVPNNFDFHTGKSLQLSDLFKKGTNYKQVIKDEIIAQIKKENDLYFDNAIAVVQKMPDDQPYYMTKDGIVVYYGLYEIAPYAAGIREFLIPYSTLRPHMKTKLAR
ncbi:DUF3298 and DUF4163 domain-containing protein [Anoxybacillus flavithermus]|uniref:Uncharacterized conserved protein n=1 Tax=Anoxybacillus flavithermus (strain DSM 21510 / WK1) TaxID=491915 RepID=B7GJ13_ANOFW|nr:DUF3298 and DUF4163 domain-containing protein [Anoxybacillus flavithermus]ACJ32559.1 Uncharacterized conserved protein [Anoxybacillus flavithermus WK1]